MWKTPSFHTFQIPQKYPYFGILKGCHKYLNEVKTRKIKELGNNPNHKEIEEILKISPNGKIQLKTLK